MWAAHILAHGYTVICENCVGLCRAGVQPVMVTGDHYLTATAVAKGINLITTKQHALIGKMPVMPACPGQPPASAGPITGAVPAPAGAAASSAGAIASSAGTAAAVPAAATAVKASGAAIFEQPVEVEQSGSSSSAQIPDKHQVRFAATVDQTGKLSHSHAAPASLVQEADAGSALQPSSALPVAASLADVHVSLPAQHLAGPAAEQTAGSTLPGTTSVSRAFAVAKSAAAAAKSGAVKAGMSADTAATESAGTVLPGVAEMPLRDNATALPMAQSAALAKPHKATAAPALPMQQAAQAMQQAADPKQPAADTSAHLPDKAAAEAASLSLSMRNLYPSPSAAMSSQKASPAVIPTAATEGAAPGRLAAAGAVVSALRSAVQNAALTVLTDAQNGTALDVFGNEVSRLPLHERTSRHLAAADAASGMTAHETEKTHSSASRRRSLDAGPGATVNANSMPVSDTHQGTSKPTAEVLPVAATSSADAPQHVLLSAAVQNSALYAQLTCSIATTEDVQMASAAQAFRAAAEGMQCIITGAVFDFLLEHAEPAVLETVLRSTVVYARMKSHQKAQLVSLLGTEGLTTAAGREFKVRCEPGQLMMEGVLLFPPFKRARCFAVQPFQLSMRLPMCCIWHVSPMHMSCCRVLFRWLITFAVD